MRRLALLAILAACGSEREPAPPTRTPPPSPKPVPAPVAGATSPAGTAGACRADPKVKGVEDRFQPVANAHCPDPMEWVRGNGMDDYKGPAVTPSVVPAWDLDGLRDYACAYACAAPGATAYLLGWNIVEDGRPLRNEDAVFVVEHAATTGAPRWTVVVMYRRAFNAWWNIATGAHSRVRPLREFPKRPTPADVEAILADTGWSYAGAPDFKLLAGNMIDENWQLALGGKPSKHHQDGIEK
jgi:hypothetical protein